MKHNIFIAQDRGGAIKRVFHYIKPEREKMFSVRIKNLITQSSWGYDKYHAEIEDGKYVIIFSCDENGVIKHQEIEVTPKDGDIYIVYNWQEFSMSFLSKRVSESEFETMVNEKRLGFPAGFQGY